MKEKLRRRVLKKCVTDGQTKKNNREFFCAVKLSKNPNNEIFQFDFLVIDAAVHHNLIVKSKIGVLNVDSGPRLKPKPSKEAPTPLTPKSTEVSRLKPTPNLAP